MIERVTYTTQPSAQSMGRYITVYAPDGSYVSRHINMEECTESALSHAQANEISGTYRFVPPEKHMSVQIIKTVPGVYTGSYIASPSAGRVNAVGPLGAHFDNLNPSGGDPYDLTNGGARTLPFAVTWPTQPTTTEDVTVNNMTELNAALAAGPGRNITIPASFGTQSGTVSIQYSDTKITMDNAARINGSNGNLWSITPGIQRIALIGGTYADSNGPTSANYWRAVSDIYYEDVVFLQICMFYTDGAYPTTSAVTRLAMVNCTIDPSHFTQPINSGEYFPLYIHYGSGAAQVNRHVILANCRFEQGNNVDCHATVRIQNSQYVVAVDSSFNMENHLDGTTGWRSTYDCVDLYVADTYIAGRINNNATPTGSQNTTDITYENVTRYWLASTPDSWSIDMTGNTGTVINGLIYANPGGFSVGETVAQNLGVLTDGGGNDTIITEWSSIPDVTSIGASHIETF